MAGKLTIENEHVRSNPRSRIGSHWKRLTWLAGIALCTLAQFAAAQTKLDLPVRAKEDFEHGSSNWKPTDTKAWKIVRTEKGNVFDQFQRSKYKPPHRSPYNIALWVPHDVTDFVLTARVRSTIRDYGHRDVCLFFGYQDPAHFYYVHYGKRADDHANQIFIVNNAARIKISEKSTSGTPWNDDWHTVRIVRRVSDGLIEVYFDDMKKPVMIAHDKTFTHGKVGLGSFDDTAQWDDIELRARPAP